MRALPCTFLALESKREAIESGATAVSVIQFVIDAPTKYSSVKKRLEQCSRHLASPTRFLTRQIPPGFHHQILPGLFFRFFSGL